MTVTVIYASWSDAYVYSVNGTYSTAAAGSSLVAATTSSRLAVGQSTGFYIYESFLSFDTSSISTDEISDVVLSLDGNSDFSTTDFTVNARIFDWGGTATTADWRTPAELAALTKVATFGTSGYVSGYNDFSSEAAFVGEVDKTGTTYLTLSSDRHESETEPTDNEWMRFVSANSSPKPKLTITHAAASVDRTGTASGDLAGLTGSASGEVTAPPAFSGTGSGELNSLTGEGSGTTAVPEFTGTGSGELSGITGDASGTSELPNNTGTASGDLPSLSGEGTGETTAPAFTGTGAGSLPGISGEGAGEVTGPQSSGTGEGSLSPLTGSGTGEATLPDIEGTGEGSLGFLTGSAEATSDYEGYKGLLIFPAENRTLQILAEHRMISVLPETRILRVA